MQVEDLGQRLIKLIYLFPVQLFSYSIILDSVDYCLDNGSGAFVGKKPVEEL